MWTTSWKVGTQECLWTRTIKNQTPDTISLVQHPARNLTMNRWTWFAFKYLWLSSGLLPLSSNCVHSKLGPGQQIPLFCSFRHINFNQINHPKVKKLFAKSGCVSTVLGGVQTQPECTSHYDSQKLHTHAHTRAHTPSVMKKCWTTWHQHQRGRDDVDDVALPSLGIVRMGIWVMEPFLPSTRPARS